MTVIILEKVPASLRGYLTRWMLEPKTGVFVGKLSRMVRDRLWEMLCEKKRLGAALMVETAQNEQGYSFRIAGQTSREVVDLDGVSLIRIPT